jgi:hypothetical protein
MTWTQTRKYETSAGYVTTAIRLSNDAIQRVSAITRSDEAACHGVVLALREAGVDTESLGIDSNSLEQFGQWEAGEADDEQVFFLGEPIPAARV